MAQRCPDFPQDLSAEHRSLLDAGSRWLRLSSIGTDGYPHTVPVAFRRIGNVLLIRVRAGTQKVRNFEADSKGAALIDTERSEPVQHGLLLRGRVTVWLEQAPLETYLRGIDPGADLRIDNWGPQTAFLTFAPERCATWTLGGR
jgi:hypothetical protein